MFRTPGPRGCGRASFHHYYIRKNKIVGRNPRRGLYLLILVCFTFKGADGQVGAEKAGYLSDNWIFGQVSSFIFVHLSIFIKNGQVRFKNKAYLSKKRFEDKNGISSFLHTYL